MLKAIDNLGQIGECFLNAGYCRETKIVDNIAYVGCKYGLMILDISDSNHPYVIGSYRTPEICYSLEVKDDYVLLACNNAGLFIVNVSNPNNPYYVSSFEFQAPSIPALKIEVQDNYAFISGFFNVPNLYILNIENIFNPVVVAYDDSDYYRNFTVLGNYIYALNYDLFVVDISEITNPTLINTFDLNGGSSIAVQDEKAYITSAELTVVDVSDPYNLNILGNCDIPTSANDIIVDDEYAYITGSGNIGVAIVDINDSLNPILFQEFDYEGVFISKQNNNLYISRIVDNYQTYNGIGIIDVENLNNINVVGEFKTCKANKFYFNGNYAYVANGFRGLTILDVSNPQHPSFVSNFETINKAINVVVDLEIAYVAVADSGFQIIDISDPLEPFLISEINPQYGDFRTIDKHSDYLYLGGEWTGSVYIYDVSDPANPVLVNQLDVNDFSYDLTIYDNYLYTAGYWGGLQIFDLTDPVNPFEVGYYPLGLALSVEANENIAFIGDPYASLQIFDTSTLSSPILTETYSIGSVKDMYCLENTLYVASSTGIHLYNVTNPYSTYESETISASYPKGIFPTQDYLYCTEDFQFNVYGDTTLVSVNEHLAINNLINFNLSNCPNPFNPVTTISFSIQEKSKITLSIFNIKGQKIKTLTDDEIGKGNHSISWYGKDENNNSVSSGVYFYKLIVNNKTDVIKKCLLLK